MIRPTRCCHQEPDAVHFRAGAAAPAPRETEPPQRAAGAASPCSRYWCFKGRSPMAALLVPAGTEAKGTEMETSVSVECPREKATKAWWSSAAAAPGATAAAAAPRTSAMPIVCRRHRPPPWREDVRARPGARGAVAPAVPSPGARGYRSVTVTLLCYAGS
jgi:hypothetical protein